MLGEIKLKNILIFVIVIFMLHYFIGKYSCRVGNKFSVGGQPAVDYAKALFNYISEGEDYITIEPDDTLIVTDTSDPDWWKGFVEGNPDTTGYFPSSHVQSQNRCIEHWGALPPDYRERIEVQTQV